MTGLSLSIADEHTVSLAVAEVRNALPRNLGKTRDGHQSSGLKVQTLCSKAIPPELTVIHIEEEPPQGLPRVSFVNGVRA